MTRHRLQPWLDHFGSLRTTLALLGLVGALVLGGTVADRMPLVALAGVAVLLALQLARGLVQHAALRRQLPLLLAHLALPVLGVELALSHLLSVEGRFELTEGVPFDGRLIDGRMGRWSGASLSQLAFAHDGFDIDYAPGRKRGATRNRVHWVDAQGQPQQAVIGDHRPLLLAGHRITTTPNKGFAPLLQWLPDGGVPVTGSVHLPSFPAQELHQSREWPLPDGRMAWVMLDFDEALIDPATAGRFKLPTQHQLVLRLGEQREVLQPGERVAVPGGHITYLGLRTWMGYRISGDPLLPWLLGTALAGTAALAWHYLRRFPRVRQPVSVRLPASHAVLGPFDADTDGVRDLA